MGKGQVRSDTLTCRLEMHLCNVEWNYCIMSVYHHSLCIHALKGPIAAVIAVPSCGEVTRTAERHNLTTLALKHVVPLRKQVAGRSRPT